jgi:hypothetical protein
MLAVDYSELERVVLEEQSKYKDICDYRAAETRKKMCWGEYEVLNTLTKTANETE